LYRLKGNGLVVNSGKIPCSFCGRVDIKRVVSSKPVDYRVAAICEKCIINIINKIIKPVKIMVE